MKLDLTKIPLYVKRCGRTSNEVKIRYSNGRYLLVCCCTTHNTNFNYPFSFSIDDLMNKGIDQIFTDFETAIRNTNYKDNFDGYCDLVSYINIPRDINCKVDKNYKIIDIRLDIGNKCNLRCKMCPLVSSLVSSNDPDEYALKVLIDALSKSQRKYSQISSSEVNESLSYDWYLDYISKLNFDNIECFRIHTNGLVLSTNKKMLQKALSISPKVEFNLSVSAINKDEFKEITGVDYFDKYMKLITELKDTRLASIFFVIQDSNYKDINNIIPYFKKLGVADKLILLMDRINSPGIQDKVEEITVLTKSVMNNAIWWIEEDA